MVGVVVVEIMGEVVGEIMVVVLVLAGGGVFCTVAGVLSVPIHSSDMVGNSLVDIVVKEEQHNLMA